MADVNISKSEDNIVIEQTNPSYHGTPEDARNYKSLQNKTTVKKPMFMLKPSLLTQKAEQIRTDKTAVSAASNSTSNKFLVLGDNKKDLSKNADPQSEIKEVGESSGFVFGENIFSRVIKHDTRGEGSNEDTTKEFKDLVCEENNVEADANSDSDALRKSADELAQKQVTQQYEEAEVITGEEEETSVVKTLCKLFLFNSDKNEWVEKGFCNVHLNDMSDSQGGCKVKSRLVVRSKGGLKVLVNTLIWADMDLARASVKAVRITAQGEDGVKSYLLTMQNATDADSLFYALSHRKMRLGFDSKKSERKRKIVDSDDSEDSSCDTKKTHVETEDDEDNYC